VKEANTEVITGPLWAARNWSADEGAGSIHDDATAAELGFRGGTVAGDVHMNQFPPVLIKVFGNEWFERGNLSLNFKNPTIDQEKVRVFAQQRNAGADAVNVWMERDDGLLVAKGTASVGDHSLSELRHRDYRACDPSELRILNRATPGLSLGEHHIHTSPTRQFQRFDTNVISDPLAWYRYDSPWGEPVAAPCTVIEFLWGVPMAVLANYVGDSVGLFGAIEVGFNNGPLLMNRDYRLVSKVLCVGQSPQTEFIWYETEAFNADNECVATMLMQSRAMKASSPEYADVF
tara:strand:+ start:3886 stop:4755 length:870 start_codon:yes stop_codon:yes gene_type:complete